MATDNSILGLRAQIAANMRALDMHPAAEIITVVDEHKWDAFIVKGSEVICRHSDAFNTPEAALRWLLEILSLDLYSKFEGKFGAK